MGSVLVVVIVGVIIVAITASAVSGGRKPATPSDGTHRAGPRHLAADPRPSPVVEAAIEWGMPPPVAEPPPAPAEVPPARLALPAPAGPRLALPAPPERATAPIPLPAGPVPETEAIPLPAAPGPAPAPFAPPPLASVALVETEPEVEVEPDGVPDERGLLHRLRALALLLAAIVGIGVAAGAVLGITILLVARFLDGALG